MLIINKSVNDCTIANYVFSFYISEATNATFSLCLLNSNIGL